MCQLVLSAPTVPLRSTIRELFWIVRTSDHAPVLYTQKVDPASAAGLKGRWTGGQPFVASHFDSPGRIIPNDVTELGIPHRAP